MVSIKLKNLEVEVLGTVDVRGTLCVSRSVPVAFQKFDVNVTMKANALVPGKMLDKILKAAEHSCIVIQTVRHGAEVNVTRL